MTEFNPLDVSMREFLDSTGVLERGSQDQIEEAKRLYKRLYQRYYKRQQRLGKREVAVSLTEEEYGKLEEQARPYRISVPQLLKEATTAYFTKVYLVPEPEHIVRIEQILADYQNKLRDIARAASGIHRNDLEQMFLALEKHYFQLEEIVGKLLRSPFSLEDHIRVSLHRDPGLLPQLHAFLKKHDR